MKEKILAALRESNKRFGLSDETLSAMAESCGITEEAGIEGWVKSMEPVLSAMQRNVDSRVNNALRGKQTPNEPSKGDDLAKLLGEMKQSILDEVRAQIQPDKTLESGLEALKKRLDEADAAKKEADYLDKLKRVGRESGLSDSMVGLTINSFAKDMDDEAIKAKFAEIKRTLVEQGLPEAGFHQQQTSDEAARKAAKDWLDKRIKDDADKAHGNSF